MPAVVVEGCCGRPFQSADASEGQSRRSAAVTITTPAESTDRTDNSGRPPGQVQDVSATQESAESPVNSSWTSITRATTYQVERETTTNLSADPVISDVATPATSYHDSNTEYDTEYLYRVRAGNDDGYGEWSDLDRIPTAREPGSASQCTTQRGRRRLRSHYLAGPTRRRVGICTNLHELILTVLRHVSWSR